MTDLLVAAYLIVGLFVSGCFVGEYAMDERGKIDAGLASFMLVMGTILWPATLGMRFYGKVIGR